MTLGAVPPLTAVTQVSPFEAETVTVVPATGAAAPLIVMLPKN
jgi:hypothetical protein